MFNPSGLGGLTSTVTFDPLTGCEEPTTATSGPRTCSPPAGERGGDRDFWTEQAHRVLAALMHAAALGGPPMHDVQAWVADPGRTAKIAVLAASESPGARVRRGRRPVPRDERPDPHSITSTIMPALAG